MFVTLVHCHVKPEHADAFADACRANHEASTREPGNLRFDVLRLAEDPTRFLLYEWYVDEAAAKVMRFNNYVEVLLGVAKVRATLLTLSVHSLRLRLSMALPGLAVGSACSVRLYFQLYQFAVAGKVTAMSPYDASGQCIAELDLDFSPELVEIVDDYVFRQSIQGRRADAQPAR